MRVIIGIDLGDERIGVATGDLDSGHVEPLTTLRRRDPSHDASTVAQLCREHAATAVVVGLPLHLQGSEGHQAAATRDWVAAVQPMVGLPFTFRDERHTSSRAEARLGRQPRGRTGGPPSAAARRARRSSIDREAAADIVQAELDAHQRTDAPQGTETSHGTDALSGRARA